jgi:hypothetical protein
MPYSGMLIKYRGIDCARPHDTNQRARRRKWTGQSESEIHGVHDR